VTKGFTVWLTGLSGAGKSTIAQALAEELQRWGQPTEIMDGDVIRTTLSKGLGFSREDRNTNIARITLLCSLLSRHGVAAISAAISPYAEARDAAREQIENFIEVYVECPLDVLKARDVKGLYAKAERGEIQHFTGVSDPYEAPENPEIVVRTDRETVAESVSKILDHLERRGLLHTAPQVVRGEVAPLSHAEQSLSHTGSTPHGGTLVNATASEEQARELRAEAKHLPRITLSPSELNDLGLIATGALSPLDGFMRKSDYERVVDDMRLANGLVWTIPVTLSVAPIERPKEGSRIALYDGDTLRAVMQVDEVYTRDGHHEARQVYRTEEAAHPGVARVLGQSDVLVGGPVWVLPDPRNENGLSLTPTQTRAEFARRGWKTIVAFQTRNPIHRAHEYIQKCALEMVDGLLVHPLVGATKADDIPAEVRLECYKALLENYYPADRVLLSTLPAAMRYAGPREAIFHAMIRKNYGCTHFIVGRDHAGVGNYYGTYDAQKLFDTFDPAELGITPLKFENTFFCRTCASMASAKTCPHDASHHVSLSGTAVRAMLRSGQMPPPEFSRPEVARILVESTAEVSLAG
jgi:sulfate adenylyltransferase/3'-phosphoadenosine 5'-phosphosulfate synthase